MNKMMTVNRMPYKTAYIKIYDRYVARKLKREGTSTFMFFSSSPLSYRTLASMIFLL